MTREGPTILIVGLGHLGGVILEFLAREDWVGRIVACSRRRDRGEARCNVARLGAVAQGLSPRIEFLKTDVSDTHRFAEAVDSVSPQLILGTATMQTWWLPDLLPANARKALQRARFGMWLPLHLAPTRSFMEGIRASSFDGPVLTAPFPDVVNCILGKIGLAPTCGIGNVDEIAAKVRWLAADRLNAPLAAVQVVLVGHHALESSAFGGDRDNAPPYHLQILFEGSDISESIGARDILFQPYPLAKGTSTAFFTAGSTLRLIRALFGHREESLHAPAPGGLPGGYPILALAGHIELAQIPDLETEAAIAINEQSHPFDGIQRIEKDGTAVFMPESVETMRMELGYECSRLPPGEAPERGRELAARFEEYAARHGVDLGRVG